MPIQTDSLNKKLYDLLKTQGLQPVPKDSENETTPVPDEAEVIKFQMDTGDGTPEILWATVDSSRKLTLYYDDDVMNNQRDGAKNWDTLRNHLKNWAMRRQLGFQLKNKDHLASDMAQRDYMNKKEKISEGYYPMGKTASYSDAVPTVKIVLQHSRSIQEGEQRYRNIAKIFLENQEGERFLAPTTKPGIARVYARHIAEGGKAHDERWNHISSLCEEYQKMAGFVRATRNNQFNESAQRLVNEGINHYQSLRESLSKMAGHRGYNAYFESWTPPLMEDDSDPTNINELFVQETLDPRIESVMPILSKLHKNIAEMKEVNELAEWADSILESPGAETLAHNNKTEEKRLQALDLEEAEKPGLWANIHAKRERIKSGSGEKMRKPGSKGAPSAQNFKDAAKESIGEGNEILSPDTYELIDEYIAKIEPGADREEIAQSILDGTMHTSELEYALQPDLEEGILDTVKKVGGKVLDKLGHGSDEDLLKDLKKKAGVRNPQTGKPSMAHSDVEKRVDEDEFAGDYATGEAGQWRNKGPKANKPATIGDLVGESQLSEMDKSEDKKGPEGKATPITPKKMADDAKKVLDKEKVKEGQEDLNALLRLLGK